MEYAGKAAVVLGMLALTAGCAAKAPPARPLWKDPPGKATITLTNELISAVYIHMDGELLCWVNGSNTASCEAPSGDHAFEARNYSDTKVYARRIGTLKAGATYPWTIRQE
jgi:hypothetical protein